MRLLDVEEEPGHQEYIYLIYIYICNYTWNIKFGVMIDHEHSLGKHNQRTFQVKYLGNSAKSLMIRLGDPLSK